MLLHLVIDSSLKRSQILEQASQRLQDEFQICDFLWSKDIHNRPLPQQWRYRSLSHSANAYLVWVSQSPIGVDIQHMTVRSPDIWQEVMTPYTGFFVDVSMPLDDREQFFLIWTATESLLKLYGLWLDQRDEVSLLSIRQQHSSLDGIVGQRIIQAQQWAQRHEIVVGISDQYCYAISI
jgi:phosphopantetheinyl transferase